MIKECGHTWVAGMMVVHPEDLEQVAKVRDVVCGECDYEYDSKDTVWTVVFDWIDIDNDVQLVVVRARTRKQAIERAAERLQLAYVDGFVTEDTVDDLIVFHSDVTDLVAE